MDPRLQRAIYLYDRGDAVGAEAELRAMIAGGDDTPELHAMLGVCLLASGLSDRAKMEVQTALSRNPNSAFAHYALSLVQQATLRRIEIPFLGRRAKAIQGSGCLGSALKAVELAPEDERYLVRLAEVHQLFGQWRKSLDAAERALALSPRNLHASIARGEALVQLGRNQEAKDTLARALAMNPEASTAQAGMGWALLRAGDYTSATNFFNEALRIHAGLGWAQEGALECARLRYRTYRWIFRCKLWFCRFPLVLRVPLAFAAIAVLLLCLGFLLNNFNPIIRPLPVPNHGHPSPEVHKQLVQELKNQVIGFTIVFITFVVMTGILFHEPISLWLVRRDNAAKTSSTEKKKEIAKAQVGFVALCVCVAVAAVVIGAISKRLLAASTGLIPGLFALWLVVKQIPADRRAIWIIYALCALVAGPIVAVAFQKTLQTWSHATIAILISIPIIPIGIAIEWEKKRALEQKHDSALTNAQKQKP